MGLGDVSDRVIPKVGLLSPPRQGGTITSRYLMPHNCHHSHAATGALCVGAAVRTAGTIAAGIAADRDAPSVVIEHPSGRIEVEILLDANGSIRRGSLIRTARRIFEGRIILPRSVLAEPTARRDAALKHEDRHDFITETVRLTTVDAINDRAETE
jgi:2-methylaconitate cis-trans-isomerase PrpF